MPIYIPVVGFEGLYQVNEFGEIYSFISSKTLKQKKDKDGYQIVNLYKQKKPYTVKVHQAVIKAFKGSPPLRYQVNHINGNRSDNSLANLEYVTNKENCLHAWKNMRKSEKCNLSKLTEKDVKDIRNLLDNGSSVQAIMHIFNISYANVYLIKARKTWKNI